MKPMNKEELLKGRRYGMSAHCLLITYYVEKSLRNKGKENKHENLCC